MSKKRKTKAQKKIADKRHTYSLHDLNQTIVTSTSPKIVEKQIKTAPYPYLVKDLTKTALLSSAIIVFQFILFSLLNNHTIRIPGLPY